ncbi:MAG: gamma-glutamylcyclotransferase family protein [Candidatus Xenobiia bacterium LiM19]
MIKKTPYFAYGSNMYTEQMTERCPGQSFEGNAVLAGKRFIINSNGVATIVPENSSRVWGIVWMIILSIPSSVTSLFSSPYK